MVLKSFLRGPCARLRSVVMPTTRHFSGWLAQKPTITRLLSLNDLRDNPGAVKKKIRVGRGPGSKVGKTCGRGMKGTYKYRRLGKRGFEGGATKLWKRTPKRGRLKNPRYARVLQPLGLVKLMIWIRTGRIDTRQVLTMKVLRDSGIFSSGRPIRHGVKLLARDAKMFERYYPKLGLPPPHLEVTDCSAQAKATIEAIGGSVKLVWFARVPLRAHFYPHKFPIKPRGNGVPPQRLWSKYNYKHPEDRWYTGAEKRKTFPIRTGRVVPPPK